MELNTKENDDEGFMEGYPDVKTKNCVDLEDLESDEGCKDIADLLPEDPFGMEFNIGLPSDPFVMGFEISLPRDPFGMDLDIEANLRAISGWIEDFGIKGYGFETDQTSDTENNDDDKLCAGMNFYWTSSMKYEQEVEGRDCEIVDAGLRAYSEDGSNDNHNKLGGDFEDLMCFGCEKYEDEVDAKDLHKDAANYGGDPVDALFCALDYLGVKDLFSVERVCKFLRDAVRDGISVWKNIHIDDPLNGKITDDDLLRLTNRARGTLCSLSLVNCLKITNMGLKHVLERNPGLTKLSVQGCRKLRVEGVLQDLKVFNSSATPGIKRLRISQLCGLTNQQFQEFKLLLGADGDRKSGNCKLRYFRPGEFALSLDDERAIDVETCPKCQQAREVYDCPSESCQEKMHTSKACRGCTVCISRCISCGYCLDNKEYEETFFLDLICLNCLDRLLNIYFLQG